MLEAQVVTETCHYVGFCALNATEQAGWAGAIGSLLAAAAAAFAAWAALHVAGKDRRYREQLRSEASVVAASFMYSDISKLAIFGCELNRAAIELSQAKPGDDLALNILTISQTAGPMRQITERMSLEWINALPAQTAVKLARAVGAFSLPVDLIEQVVQAWQKMAIPAESAQKQLKDHADGLRIPLRNLVPFFRWYGEKLPEYAFACRNTESYIYAEVRPPMDEVDLGADGNN